MNACHPDPESLSRGLAQRLQSPVRTIDRTYRFAAQLSYGRHRGPPPPGARPAAVAVVLYPRQGVWCIPFTLRPGTLTAHAGQVSLPGGAVDAGESDEDCALRELHEEIGVPAAQVRVLGRMSPVYVFRSGFQVQPLLMLAGQPLAFHPNPAEVEQLLEIPVADLFSPDHHSTVSIVRQSLCFEAPCLRFDGYRIWGATATIVGEFLSVAEGLFAAPHATAHE